jgi:hypothetical protein
VPIRKLATLGIACMEENGVVFRGMKHSILKGRGQLQRSHRR